MAYKTQKLRVLYPSGDEKRYIGSTATGIVTALWQGHIDFTKSKNVDEWMKHTFFPATFTQGAEPQKSGVKII